MPITRSQQLQLEVEEQAWREQHQVGVVRETQEQSEDSSTSEDSSASTSGESSSTADFELNIFAEEEQPVAAAPTVMATQRARFQYKTFHGKTKEDPDEWLEDFVGTAQANAEDGVKLTILPGVLRGEARPWFTNLPRATKANWDEFKIAFLQEFRKVGEESEALIKIGQMRMGHEESVRHFLQRFQRVAKKIEPAPSDSMLMRWFVSSLPIKMGVSVRQAHPATLEQAVEAAQSYQSADISSSKIRHKKKKYDSSSSSSESSSDDSSTEDESSDSDSESDSSSDSSEDDGHRRRKHKKKSKKKEKKKSKKKSARKPEKVYKKVLPVAAVVSPTAIMKEKKAIDNRMDELTNQLKALSVHLAGVQPDRRKVNVNRAHVWCVTCKQFGHTPAECPGWSAPVQYVKEEVPDSTHIHHAQPYGGSRAEVVEYFYEEEPDTVYQISAGPKTLQGRPMYANGPQPMQPRPAEYKGGVGGPAMAARTSIVICWNCGEPGHYSNSCPKPKMQGNGAPALLCGICKKEGHLPSNCPIGAAARVLIKKPEIGGPSGAQAPGEAGVNFLSMEWQEETKEKETWDLQGELAGMETPQEDSDHCYKVSTRATQKKTLREEKDELKQRRKQLKELEREVVPTADDSDYRRDHPKFFFPKVNEEVKKQLEELAAAEEKTALDKDLKAAKAREAAEIEKAKEEPKPCGKLIPYDIQRDVRDCPATVTVGQLIRDNPLYRRQLKEMLVGRRRRKLPKVGTAADVMMVCEDMGAPEIDVQISGCVLSYVPIDGGSGVNIMIEAIAHQLGFKEFQPTARTMRLANGARVIPTGTLTNIPTLIGGQEFKLNYLVMRPARPSTYPVLIGRPWLYGAKVTSDWGKKEFRFGKPSTSVSWAEEPHQGETTQQGEEYDSEYSSESDADDVFMMSLVGNLTEEDVFHAKEDLVSVETSKLPEEMEDTKEPTTSMEEWLNNMATLVEDRPSSGATAEEELNSEVCALQGQGPHFSHYCPHHKARSDQNSGPEIKSRVEEEEYSTGRTRTAPEEPKSWVDQFLDVAHTHETRTEELSVLARVMGRVTKYRCNASTPSIQRNWDHFATIFLEGFQQGDLGGNEKLATQREQCGSEVDAEEVEVYMTDWISPLDELEEGVEADIRSECDQKAEEDVGEEGSGSQVAIAELSEADKPADKKVKAKSVEGPVYGGMRLAHLEETLDPTLRNKMEVIRSGTYRQIAVQGGKTFYLGYALKSTEEKAIQELLAEYLDVFAWNHSDITGVSRELGEHSIDLMLGARPVRQRQYRMNPKYSLMVKEEIDRLLEAGFIYPVLNSKWVSPIVTVPKKIGVDGKVKIRVCQDFRKLNEATKKDHYPIPFTDSVLDLVAGKEVYSFLDGYSGYNQVWIRDEDQLKTAFTTEWGVFAFRRMPFGLCNAPGMFQRLMMNIFHDYLRKFLEVFIDDFAVYGETKEHAQHLRMTFQRCRETGLKLHPGKCFFGVQEGILLGHKVSKKGIEVDKEKIAVWLAVAFPTNLTEVQGFLGCVGYYRRFIIHFSKVALALTLMLKKDSDFEPTAERMAAFNELKKRLAEAPVLVTPDWSKDFHVYVDVSGFCIGAVLSQLDQDEKDHPIYFASRQLAPAEKNYSPTDREALGIIYCCKKFRHYLLGYKVIFHTDHNALKYMVNKPDVTGRIARWVLLLQEFDYEVRIRPGKRHSNADFFSRIAGEEND